jgi:hypothetical protein
MDGMHREAVYLGSMVMKAFLCWCGVSSSSASALPRSTNVSVDEDPSFAGCASCCILFYACGVGDLCSCFPQHLVTLAVIGFINLKLGVMPSV